MQRLATIYIALIGNIVASGLGIEERAVVSQDNLKECVVQLFVLGRKHGEITLNSQQIDQIRLDNYGELKRLLDNEFNSDLTAENFYDFNLTTLNRFKINHRDKTLIISTSREAREANLSLQEENSQLDINYPMSHPMLNDVHIRLNSETKLSDLKKFSDLKNGRIFIGNQMLSSKNYIENYDDFQRFCDSILTIKALAYDRKEDVSKTLSFLQYVGYEYPNSYSIIKGDKNNKYILSFRVSLLDGSSHVMYDLFLTDESESEWYESVYAEPHNLNTQIERPSEFPFSSKMIVDKIKFLNHPYKFTTKCCLSDNLLEIVSIMNNIKILLTFSRHDNFKNFVSYWESVGVDMRHAFNTMNKKLSNPSIR